VAGSWFDSFYISADDVFNPATDPFIGRVEHSGGLAANADYSGSLTATMPGVVDGDYFVFLVTDSRGAVPDSDRANNRMASEQAIEVELPPLPLDTLVDGVIAADQD